ncbi:MAG: plasmid replication protein RepB [Oceanospirillaceae bacterium]|nr:plasmid replication protein RepB [Oceanospirillaceae bacterium]
MQEKEIKIRFDAGDLKAASVVKAPLENGWNLLVTDKNKLAIPVERKRGGIRLFKMIDAACSTAREIGFVDINVKMS